MSFPSLKQKKSPANQAFHTTRWPQPNLCGRDAAGVEALVEAEVPWEWDASVAPKAGSCEIATAPLAFF